MHKFYFNECLPNCEYQTLLDGFILVLKSFNELIRQKLDIDNAIITEKPPAIIILNDYDSLHSLIEGIPDNERELRQFAFSLFRKYPIHSHFDVNELQEEALLEYYIVIGGENFSAINLGIVQQNEGFLFSLPIHNDLKQQPLKFYDNNKQTICINNFYGDTNNIKEIKEIIISINNRGLSILDELKVTLTEKLNDISGHFYTSESFDKEFKKLTNAQQESILNLFKRVAERPNQPTLFSPDNINIKDVTPANKSVYKVYELRVYTPTALRVYFNESNGNVYLASIGFKSAADQNKDINNAYSKLLTLIKTN